MTADPDNSLARRAVLTGIGSTVLAAGVGVGTVTADQHDADVVVTIDNVGSDAWEVTEADGEEVAPVGEENPTITLTVGTRYTFENEGGSVHPLAFRDDDNDPLVSQADGGSDDGDGDDGGSSGPGYSITPLSAGTFADDPDVDVVQDGDQITFTVTDELAGALDNYVCTVHSSMVGDIETEEPADEEEDEATTQTDDAAPGFGLTAAVAGLAGVAAYARRRGEAE